MIELEQSIFPEPNLWNTQSFLAFQLTGAATGEDDFDGQIWN